METEQVVMILKERIAAFKQKYSHLYDDSQENRLQSSNTIRTGASLQSSNAKTN
jgi:hypothetical protein